MADLAAILEALGGAVVDHDGPCPTCGVTPLELELVKRKRAMDAAFRACEAHLAGCRTCRGWGGPYCAEMDRLRERHFTAWQAYYGQKQGVWDPWRA